MINQKLPANKKGQPAVDLFRTSTLRWKILKDCWQWIDTTARENSMQLAHLSPTQRMMNDLLGTNIIPVITERFHLAKNASTRSKLSPKF